MNHDFLSEKQKCQQLYKELGYWKDYYQHVTKNKIFYCMACDCEINISHKARHIKTKKHQKNENKCRLNDIEINDVLILDLDG